MAKTLFEKIWDSHVVADLGNDNYLIYVDRHLLHEANTPHAFEGIRIAGLPVRRPELTIGVVDHVIPTTQRAINIKDQEALTLVELFEKNCKANGITSFSIGHLHQGICHVVGPELGFTLPGATLVCGDSHTSTHGAFGVWAFGIGISQVEMVFATQTVVQRRPRNFKVHLHGDLPLGVTAKDIVLHLIGKIGTAGGTGYVLEYTGQAVNKMSMESRMTLCNMAIEAGARSGLVAPDETTFAYLKGRQFAPEGDEWDRACEYWKTLQSDTDARYEREISIDISNLAPHVTWGTSPQDVIAIDGAVPTFDSIESRDVRASMERAMQYMDISPGQSILGLPIDRVFIGSCTNARIEDLRAAAQIAKGRKVSSAVHAMVVPGSETVRRQAEREGLAKIFMDAGFEWRYSGCSMCLGMNPDLLEPGQRCASTSNRNFEGRQGKGGRTHLMSPAMAAAAAIFGKLVDVREI